MTRDFAGFALDVRHWPTVVAFRSHLARYDPAIASWSRAVVIHHTVSPLPANWHGERSIRALAAYYRRLGWSAGPHLFVASGSPDPANDGIWQMTPLDHRGIHAQAANAFAFGIEHVGNFDRDPMPPDVVALGAGAAAALLDWLGIVASDESVTPHRAYAAKSCPGRLVDMRAYVRAVRALQQTVATPSPPGAYTDLSPIMAPATITRDALARALRQRCAASPYAGTIDQIAAHLYDQAVTVGVDPLVVAAQMCHETANLTSAWSLPPHHNPAGIGVTGAPRAGVSFPDLQTGITAQIGRLVAYATLLHKRTPQQEEIVRAALIWRALPAACHGSAVTLRALGATHNLARNCGWAMPGTHYGVALAAIANHLRRLANA